MYDNYGGISAHRYLAGGNQITGSRSAFLTGTNAFQKAARRYAQSASGVDYAGAADTDSMSASEYKAYIAGVIDGISIHPSREGDMSAVELSDEVLAKMKEDPDYANDVLNQIREEFGSSAASSQDTQAFSYSWLTDVMDQVQTERWLSPFDTTWGYDKFSSKKSSSLWSNTNSNLMVQSLMMKAQTKQMEMAQQAARQMRAAKLPSADSASAAQKAE